MRLFINITAIFLGLLISSTAAIVAETVFYITSFTLNGQPSCTRGMVMTQIFPTITNPPPG
jgi:hypothetical protein